jgi:hypothetical protein
MSEESAKDKPFEIDYTIPSRSWMESTVKFRKGTYCYPAAAKHEKYLDLPNPREWQPAEGDWKLPETFSRYLCAMRSVCG